MRKFACDEKYGKNEIADRIADHNLAFPTSIKRIVGIGKSARPYSMTIARTRSLSQKYTLDLFFFSLSSESG